MLVPQFCSFLSSSLSVLWLSSVWLLGLVCVGVDVLPSMELVGVFVPCSLLGAWFGL